MDLTGLPEPSPSGVTLLPATHKVTTGHLYILIPCHYTCIYLSTAMRKSISSDISKVYRP